MRTWQVYLELRALAAVCWLAWGYPFVFRAPHLQRRPSITAARPTRIGLLLECTAIFLAFAFGRSASPGLALVLPALALAVVSIVMAWRAVAHLGRQFRISAGLYEDHELVRTGPYAVVRHPIYASLLGMLLATILLVTPWRWAIASLVLFIAGTEIRVRAEDGLLLSRFGDDFRCYRRRVRAYIPFIR
jgi:protein-S-isoprenylcysteine O-methyltransferase Ste14